MSWHAHEFVVLLCIKGKTWDPCIYAAQPSNLYCLAGVILNIKLCFFAIEPLFRNGVSNFRTDDDDELPVDAKGHADITIQGNILRVDRSGKLQLRQLEYIASLHIPQMLMSCSKQVSRHLDCQRSRLALALVIKYSNPGQLL